jgi:hypothetical protein
MSNKYSPRLNDYVKWKEHVEGWVYFVDKEYITIETNVFPKDEQNVQACSLHKNNRVLVLCYHEQWNQLNCLGYRENKYSETLIQNESSRGRS